MDSQSDSQSQIAPPFNCRIILTDSAMPSWYPIAFVEVVNVSPETLDFQFENHLFQHLNILVRNHLGEIVSFPGWYGSRFGTDRAFQKIPTQKNLYLGPGESVVHSVGLLGRIATTKIAQATYSAVAILQYGAFETISEPVSFSLGPIPAAYWKYINGPSENQ